MRILTEENVKAILKCLGCHVFTDKLQHFANSECYRAPCESGSSPDLWWRSQRTAMGELRDASVYQETTYVWLYLHK